MKIEYKLMSNPGTWMAGKIVLNPESPEEEMTLNAFREHVQSPQRGRKFTIVFKRRGLAPQELHEALMEVAGRAD